MNNSGQTNSGDRPDTKPRERLREIVNLQSFLQSVLLGILSQYCTITIGKPQRKSTVTFQFIKVRYLEFGHDKIEVQKFIKQRAKEIINNHSMEGITEKTAKRRCQSSKRREVVYLLIDLLQEYHYHVSMENEETEGISGNVSIYRDKDLLYSKNEICDKGLEINKYIFEKLGNNKQQVIAQAELVRFL